MKCSNCNFTIDADARFCEKCGNPLVRTCNNFGAAIKPTANFYKRCGTALSSLLSPQSRGERGLEEWGEGEADRHLVVDQAITVP